jgi:hypothetical protein
VRKYTGGAANVPQSTTSVTGSTRKTQNTEFSSLTGSTAHLHLSGSTGLDVKRGATGSSGPSGPSGSTA